MTLCVACGCRVEGPLALCCQHGLYEQGWAATNRIMCDLFHRGQGPRRVHADDRDAFPVEVL